MTQSGAWQTVGDLAPGDHLCCIHETEQEHRALLAPYLRQGLERHEKLLYIVDSRTAGVVLEYLRSDGMNPDPCLASGQLNILTCNDCYFRGGVFEPERMIALLLAETDQAVKEGYAALRATGEMSWALRGLPGSGRLIEYEAKLNRYLPGIACVALCQYDRRCFPPGVLLDVLRTHPRVAVGGKICPHSHYVPPETFLRSDHQEDLLEHWLADLAGAQSVHELAGQGKKE